jgi:hypothetical protein
MIQAYFLSITKTEENKFTVIFAAEDGKKLYTICKWITNSHDVNHYIAYDTGFVVGLNEKGKYSISEEERLKAVEAVSKFDNFHKSGTRTYFQIADANWCMYHTNTFATEEEARDVIKTEYINMSKKDGSDEYWNNRKQVVIKVTEIQEVLG